MIRVLTIGMTSAGFFSATYILNRLMTTENGHWIWTGPLRWFYVIPLIGTGFLITNHSQLRKTLDLFRRHWWFWIMIGSFGCGLPYILMCFSASYAPAWIVATAWQSTIIASPLALRLLGRRVPLRGVGFSLLILVGIVLAQVERINAGITMHDVLYGAVPCLFGAIWWPLGAQLVHEAQQGEHAHVPHIPDAIMANPLARTLLMALGSMPFWFFLLAITQPGMPTTGQITNTLAIAVSSGIFGMTLFLWARQSAKTPYEIAAVDATQSGEVVFALLGDALLFGGVGIGLLGSMGIFLIFLGLIFYVFKQKT